MRDDLIAEFFHLLGKTFPRSTYCLILQLGDSDDVDEMDLECTDLLAILPATSRMYNVLETLGVDVKKHMEEIIPEVEDLLSKALVKAILEAEETEKNTEENK